MSPREKPPSTERLSRKELTHDIRYNLGAAAVGLTMAGGVGYATVELLQDNPSTLEVTAGGSAIGALGLYIMALGAKNAFKAFWQRRQLDQDARNLEN